MKNRLSAFILITAVCSGLLFSGCVQKEPMRMKFKQGEIARYKMDMAMKGNADMGTVSTPMRLNMNIFMSLKTLSVAPDNKSAVIAMTLDESEMETRVMVAGNEQKMTIKMKPGYIKLIQNGVVVQEGKPQIEMADICGKPSEMSFDDRGKVSNIKMAENFNLPINNDLGGMSFILPEKPVRKGESWTAERKINMPELLKLNKQSPTAFIARDKYTMQGIEKVDGKACYKLQVETNVTNESGNADKDHYAKIQSKGFLYLDKDSCRLVKADMEVKQDMAMEVNGLPMKMKATMTISINTLKK